VSRCMSITINEQTLFNVLVASLNKCIESCVDAEKSYGLAAADVRDPSFKKLLLDKSLDRAKFVVELQTAIAKLGAYSENQGSVRGLAQRGWLGLRKVLEGKDEWMISNECQKAELIALKHYESALEQASIDGASAEVRAMLETQRDAIKATIADLRHRYS